ncbi:NAD-dependent epimerase/dehydratase family protein [Actinoplanes sp. URMC 104]|uniref:NAD-dependent epimerase/dehydratase family protein n=1 Tax=Actinoplanes sp. URMC 104 TaxID=3423409 RepID=UPI003F1D1262
MAETLLTGAAGRIGRMLRARLCDSSWRLTDLRPEPGVTALDVTDAAAVERACAGVESVVHLGGIAGGGSFDEVLEANVRGTENVLRAAVRAGVSRVVIASSNHAVGFASRADGRCLPDDLAPRPDSYYGWSKAAMESLGRMYHDRYGLHVVCLRIGACFDEPGEPRHRALWLSPDDAARLVRASLAATGWHLVWGVSANSERWFSQTGGRAIGYAPQDDAADWPLAAADPALPEQFLVGGSMPGRALTGEG